MAHRAGTADAPIPGLITSRRNPAYRLKPRPKEHAGGQGSVPPPAKGREALKVVAQAAASRRRRSRSRSRRVSPVQTEEDERRSRERKEEEERERREREDVEARKRKIEEEEAQRKRWAEQEAKWAEERRVREEQRRLEEQRQADRQKKLKGAFAMEDELDDNDEEDQERARELAERQRRRAAAAANAVPALLPSLASGSGVASFSPSAPASLPGTTLARPTTQASLTSGTPEDAVRLRASLADPSAPRMHAPGEVAEHFRRLSEMKRRFRRAEFGGPDRRREPSRSRSRDKYNSVWIRPGSKR